MNISSSPITLTLILLNVVLSLYAWNSNKVFQKWMLHPYSFGRKGNHFTLFTSAFIHADSIHLIMNMFALFSFGQYVEIELSAMQYITLYGISILTSALPSLIKHKHDAYYYTLGASGAVSGVAFAFIVLHPLAKLSLVFFPISMPAILFGILYIVLSIYAQRRAMDNLNHDAHIAGALTGAIFTFWVKPESVRFLLDLAL